MLILMVVLYLLTDEKYGGEETLKYLFIYGQGGQASAHFAYSLYLVLNKSRIGGDKLGLVDRCVWTDIFQLALDPAGLS